MSGDVPAQVPGLDLQQGFAAFTEAARSLEQRYAALRARAAEIDVELAATNAILERTLAERETVLAALPVGLIAVDRDGGIVWRNARGAEMCEAAGDPDLARAAVGEHECSGLRVRVQRVDLPDGGTLVLLEDRSQVARLEREVDRLDRLAGLSELALGIAHEIKNPLNGVQGFAQLLARSDDPETMRRHAGRVVEGVEQIDAIVKAMLAFARSDEGAQAAVRLDRAVAEAAAAAGLPSARITSAGELGVAVPGAALVRVLANLFANAAEAAGGGAVRLDVAARVQGGELVLDVRDDGPGVPAELAERVFEPLFTTKGSGHGLGLALAARVLRFLGGRLRLCNAGVAGAHFELRLPLGARGRDRGSAEARG